MFKGIQSIAKFAKEHNATETTAVFNLNNSKIGFASTFLPIEDADGERTGNYELVEYVMGDTFAVKNELVAQGYVWDKQESLYKRVRQTTPQELRNLETGVKGAVTPENIAAIESHLVMAVVNYNELP